LRNQARRGALPYDADDVTRKYWKPVLKEMQEMISLNPKPEKVNL
jgi:hypothetical protein